MTPSDSTALVGAAVGSGVDLRKTTPNRATSTPHHLTATSTPSSSDEASKSSPSAARCIVDASQSDRRHMSVQVQRRPVPPGGRSAATTDTTPARDQDPRNLQTIQYKSNAERSSARSDRFSTTSTSRSIVPSSAKSARPREDGDRRGADISLRPPQDPHPSYGKFQSTTRAACSTATRCTRAAQRSRAVSDGQTCPKTREACGCCHPQLPCSCSVASIDL